MDYEPTGNETAGDDEGLEQAPARSEGGPIEAALAPLEQIGDRPLTEHPDVYQQIHSTLQDALTDIDGT